MPKISVVRADRFKAKRTTTSIMLELFGALLVLLTAAIVYYAVKGGVDASALVGRIFANLGVAFLTAFVIEAFNAGIRMHQTAKKSAEKHQKNFKNCLGVLKKLITDTFYSYFFITPLIVVFLFPVYTPIYVVFVSTLFGELIGKMIFGGFGSNIFNPAIAGRVFGAICFSEQLTSATVVNVPTGGLTDLSAGATINSMAQSGGWLTSPDIGLGDLFLGNYRGTLGETFALVILVLGVYLMIRKVIDYRLTLTYIGGFFIIALLIGLISKQGSGSFEYALRQCLYGGVLFGGVFCLTDPVTSPVQGTGKVIFALLAAVITALIRYLASAPEGVAYSILAVNMLAPAIDRLLSHKSNHKMWIQYTALGVGAASLALVGLCTGDYLYKNQPSTSTEQAKIVTTVVERELILAPDCTAEGVIL